jgi:signal peptidase I
MALVPLLFLRPVRIQGRSMEPGLADGSVRLALRGWCAGPPAPGQIWLVQTSAGLAVKRLVGLPGDQVDLRDGALWINGKFKPESYPVRADRQAGGSWRTGTGYFLLGDNRPDSRDSRAWGSLPGAGLRGRILTGWLQSGAHPVS